MAEPGALSEGLRIAAERERAVVLDRVEALREQSHRMHELAAAVDEDLASTLQLLRQLDEILGVAPQMSINDVDEELRGQRLREVAVRVLKRHKGQAATVHYKEWYELLVADGHRVAGKDPVATFLTQVSRAREVEKVGRRSGLYRLVAA
jgi:hypothetical protein